jgi:hypothetical protein
VVAHRPGPADAYVTFGAGTRGVGLPGVDGDQFDAEEIVGDVTAGEVFQRRTGRDPESGVVSLGFPSLRRENASLPYDIELGAVADQLALHDVDRAVVANADGVDGPGSDDRHREAALALVDGAGVVENGQVGSVLLTPDPAAPFGVKLDADRVVDAFDKAWDKGDERGVVLVEASDLARLRRYMRFTTAEQFVSLRGTALRDADAMFGRLLEQVDPDRDAVMVVGPSEGRRKLTVTALRTPGSSPGYIRTASSQHDGVAIAVDVGPTLLDLFGIDFTDKMEGRPYEIVPSSASLSARSDQFIEEAEGSARRAERLAPMTAILVGLIAIVVLATVLVVAVGESVSSRRRKGLAWVALFSLATLPSTLLVQLIPGGIAGFGVYLLVVAASAAVIATAAWYLPRPYGPMIGMLAFMLGVILVDAMTGSHMHYNAVFGYSPTANSRLYGISNYSFGVVLTSTILLATFIIVFARTRFAFALAMALMGFVLVVEGLPAWGSDVGGVLAGVPTFLLFVLLVRQRKIRVRTLVLAVVVTAIAIAVFAGIDLMRPATERAHLGRLVERVDQDGFGPLFAIVQRKFAAALRESTRSLFAFAIPIGIALVVALDRVGNKPLAQLRERIPLLSAALVSIYVGAFLGSALNDSGAIVGGLVFFTLSGALAYAALEATSQAQTGGAGDVKTSADARAPQDVAA